MNNSVSEATNSSNDAAAAGARGTITTSIPWGSA